MNNKHYLVVGLGVTGLSAIEHLLRQGASVTVTDSRASPPKLPDLNAKFPQVPVILRQIAVPEHITDIILSPGVPLDEPGLQSALARNLPIIGDIELFARLVDKPVLAVTGSNGKSTVTTLLGLMAHASGLNAGVGGNLGTAALSLLDPARDCYILELSSYQLETLESLRPIAATILNITPEHMDRYADLSSYAAAKQRIYPLSQQSVFNRADPLTRVPAEIGIPTVSFGLDVPTAENYGVIEHAGQRWLAKGTIPLMPAAELKIPGDHNVANALAALAMGEIAGFNQEAMLSTLRSFTGLEHCCETVINAKGVLWIDDSKGTNVGATLASLQGLAKTITGKWIIILGGEGKNADFSGLVVPLQDHCRAAILIGAEQQQLWNLLHGTTPCFLAKDLAAAVAIAQQQAQVGDGVLLSPACASLDMFKNFAHRGEVFKREVLQLLGTENVIQNIKQCTA